MEHTADVARLTVRLATAPGSVDAFSRTPSMVCADIVTRAHAAGLTAATVYPGSYPRVPEQGARQISLSEPPELSVINLYYDTQRIERMVPTWCVVIEVVQLVRGLSRLLRSHSSFGDVRECRDRTAVLTKRV